MHKVRERLGNLCNQGNLMMAAQQNNISLFYLHCNSFFICIVTGEFGLINVHLFDIFPPSLFREVRD